MALVAGGLLFFSVRSASATDTSSLTLQRPGSSPETLTPPTTGQTFEPASPRLPTGQAGLPRHVSFGINDIGGQLRIHLNPDWAVEGRFLTGSADSDVGPVHAMVIGGRGYHFLPEHHRLRFYLGAEAAYVQTSLHSVNTTNPNSVVYANGFGNTSGYALGGFGGMEFRLLRRIALDVDIGPYMIGLREHLTGVSDSTLDFVMNTAINVYLF